MDFLKKELERKRKMFQEDFGSKKFVKRGEIERKKIEHIKEQERREMERKLATKSSGKEGEEAAKEERQVAKDAAAGGGKKKEKEEEAIDHEIDSLVLPRGDVIKRLRQLKHPITLFGEDDDARLARLKLILKTGAVDPDGELLEGQRNDFLRDIVEMKKGETKHGKRVDKVKRDKERGEGGEKDGVGPSEGGEGQSSDDGASDEEDDIDAARLKANFDDLCDEDKILVFFKKLVKEWKHELERKGDSERKTVKEKALLATFKQCVRYLDPMFRMCRRKELYDDIREALLFMVNSCRKRDYLSAMDKYIKLAIGNAPWPIGVTMVGIHERSAREKIHTNSVAHIMNDETTRKYLQSVKRLMTYCQRKYPSAPSKSVEFNSLANGSDLEALLAEERFKGVKEGAKDTLRLTAGEDKS